MRSRYMETSSAALLTRLVEARVEADPTLFIRQLPRKQLNVSWLDPYTQQRQGVLVDLRKWVNMCDAAFAARDEAKADDYWDL
jgi:hypothetical protein